MIERESDSASQERIHVPVKNRLLGFASSRTMVSLKSFKPINETESDSQGEYFSSRRQANLSAGILNQEKLLSSHQHRPPPSPPQPEQSNAQNVLHTVQGHHGATGKDHNEHKQLQHHQHRQQAPSAHATNDGLEYNNNSSVNDQNSNPIVARTKANKMQANNVEQGAAAVAQQQQKSTTIAPLDTIKREEEGGSAVVAVTMTSSIDCLNEKDAITSNIDNNIQTTSAAKNPSSISIVVVRHDNNNQVCCSKTSKAAMNNAAAAAAGDGSANELRVGQCLENNEKSVDDGPQSSYPASLESTSQQSTGETSSTADNALPPIGYCDDLKNVTNANAIYQDNLIVYSNEVANGKAQQSFPMKPSPNDVSSESRMSVNTESDHFEIVWSNLSYRIEPKWHKKFNYIDRAMSYFMPGQTVDNHSSATSTASSSAGMDDNQHQMHASAGADSHLAASTKQRAPSDPIEIFSNVNGTIKSGQMTAVLGPSGAGKTTLLNCLTGKLRKGVSGHINLKGANGKHLKMCTIPQKDHLLEQLTVEENLWFASKIKNPEYGFDHVKNIERVIDLLGLKRCRSAKIKKISGGQHKRVSIAQELLSNPDILVLDEPTSGLDFLTCYKTISMLRDLVELSANNDFMKPMAIIVTIHQPQPKVFNLFHHVYILANGGRVIYEGAPERSVETITQVTGLHPVDATKATSISASAVDPASFLIEIASEEYGVEVINTLNDYQRSIFNLTQRHRGNFRVSPQDFESKDNQSKGAKINHAFTPEFERKSNEEIHSVFVVAGDAHDQSSDTKDSPPIIRQRSGNESKKSSTKTKRKKKPSSNYSDDSSKRGSSHDEDLADAHDSHLYLSEQLLYTRVPNHKGRFWSHTATLTHRTLLTIRRDPLLMTSRVLFHLMIPILMGHVYGKATGAANACPHYEPEIDITQIPSLVESKRIEFMLEELHMSIENVSMFFIIMYAFAAAVLALNALSFPLNMQVLLKETRNGWYSMSSYVVAKTLADLPLELTMPCMTMLLVYPLTGQPSSYLQWRMFTICLIMTLCSLIAQTQALILGALVMNSVQTAVFVSQASQLPWVILAGFTIRIKRLSEPLKLISLTSFYRLGCEAITLTRYGFGICPCDPQEITGGPVRLVGIPDQLRTVAQYWLDSVEASKATVGSNDTNDSNSEDATINSMIATTLAPETSSPPTKTDIFQHLANQLSFANSYGVNITSCDDVAPDRIRAINLGDNWLVARIWHLLFMLIIMKILLYYAVRFSIGIRL